MTFVYANLTCKDASEAQAIADLLLADHLIACAKIGSPLSSTYWWKDQVEQSSEVLLIMETHESRLQKIEEAIQKVHSYDTFVLTAVPMVHASKGARLWMQDALKLLGN